MRLNIPHNAKRFCTCEYLPQKRNHIRKYISFRNPKAELRTNAGKEEIAEVANGSQHSGHGRKHKPTMRELNYLNMEEGQNKTRKGNEKNI